MDKRLYQRIMCRVECILIPVDIQNPSCEIEGVIVDMSESELKISFNKSDSPEFLASLKVNDTIQFQAYEEYEVFDEQKEVLISGDAVIMRIVDNDSTIEVGCKYTKQSDELNEYIKDRKVTNFINGMNKYRT